MTWELVLAHVVLPSAVAIAAAFGAWRCWRLLRLASDPRLVKLLWFYALFAASLVALAVWTGQLVVSMADVWMNAHASGVAEASAHQGLGAEERVDIFLLAHHVLMLASLGVAVQAFSHRRAAGATVAAVAGIAFFGPFIPVALAVEAAMALYLAVQAVLNHMERRTPGALQVAAGFALFFVGHLGYFLFHQPGAGRVPLGDVFALVGIVLLVQLLPRPSA